MLFSTSIEKNHESYEKLTRKNIGAGAAIKIEAGINAQKVQVGRHFEETDDIYSYVSVFVGLVALCMLTEFDMWPVVKLLERV